MIKYEKGLTPKEKKKIYDSFYTKAHSKKRNGYSKEYYIKHREKSIAYSRQYQKDFPEKAYLRKYKWNLKFYYGINLDTYNKLSEIQKGNCAICGTNKNELKHPLAVDHNHTTNKIRGLLCVNCNMMIGFAKDNVLLLKKAIKYLNKYNKA
jgi:hypothetical protein